MESSTGLYRFCGSTEGNDDVDALDKLCVCLTVRTRHAGSTLPASFFFLLFRPSENVNDYPFFFKREIGRKVFCRIAAVLLHLIFIFFIFIVGNFV